MNHPVKRLIFSLLAAAPLLARAGGDEVVVVYNFAPAGIQGGRRAITPWRVRFPKNKSTVFRCRSDGGNFARRIPRLAPVAAGQKTRGGWSLKFGPFTIPATNGQPARVGKRVIASKIRYAVLCYGVPLKFRSDTEIHEPNATNMPPEMRRNEAAVDSELALLPLVKMDFPLTGPFPNWLYGATNAAIFNPTNGMLMVARLDGPTPEIARGLVDKALQAERDGLWGRAYFDARGLEKTNAYFLGDEWMLGAAAICRELGFETTLDDKPETFPASFPLSQIAIYAGWYDTGASGPFTLPVVEFMPGAFAYHLHSYSASTLHSANEYWTGPLLAKGATCTLGCVYEPYLSGTPNVAIIIARFVMAGFTFGEAAYAAQPVLSWQTTVVGDPLYRPFGKSQPVLHAELTRQKNPLLEWSYLRLANVALVHGTRAVVICNMIENLDVATNSAVLTEKLADLYSALGKPSSAILSYQNALKMNPSPEQRIRLRLTLGEKFQAQDRDAEAVENYQKLLDEAPNYPGKDTITRKMATLQPPVAGTNTVTQP